jgi:hypothetical protein
MEVSELNILLFGLLLLITFTVLAVYSVYIYWIRARERCLSPYTSKPLRYGRDVPLSSVEKIMRFLHYKVRGYHNRVFLMRRSMICRETGRIFPNSVSFTGRAQVDWNFLNKKYPGTYVSWGSLTEEQKIDLMALHGSLEGFQTEISCPFPSPRSITPEYVYVKPGPLYVDLRTHVLLGWKVIPDTSFEVLVVQKPKEVNTRDRILKSRFKKNKHF